MSVGEVGAVVGIAGNVLIGCIRMLDDGGEVDGLGTLASALLRGPSIL